MLQCDTESVERVSNSDDDDGDGGGTEALTVGNGGRVFTLENPIAN